MDFVTLDVETASADMASICAIGLFRFADGAPAGGMHFLVDPQDHFDALNISIHGITPEMVAGQPTMAAILPMLQRQLSGHVVVHHTHFDRVALMRAADRCGLEALACRWLDTARVARRTWPEVAIAGYGLRDLAARIGFTFQHHDAREDARAAGLVLIEASRITGLTIADWFARVGAPIDLERAAKSRAKFVGNPAGHLAGEVVVFTGALALPRVDASDLAAAAGCEVHPGVTKATTILVVGDQDIRKVGAGGKSAKHVKAEGMIVKGAALRVIGESDFVRLVQPGG